jgi:hypothetical protein
MRTYILTDRERNIIKNYLTLDKKIEGFRMLKSRVKKFDSQRAAEDLRLIKQFREVVFAE